MITTVNYKNACLPDADFRNADLKGANFNGAYLHKADFRFADLRDATFVGADLRSAIFVEADLTGADLTGTDTEGADFAKAKGVEDSGAEIEYQVELSGTVRSYARVTVKAKNEEEARKLARHAAVDADWEIWDHEPEYFDIDEIQVKKGAIAS